MFVLLFAVAYFLDGVSSVLESKDYLGLLACTCVIYMHVV